MRAFGLGIQSRLHASGQFLRRSDAPVVQENDARVFVGHVIVDGDDVDAAAAQALQDVLKLILIHRKIPIDNGLLIGPGKSVCAPEGYIQLIFAVETLLRLNGSLSHFFARVFSPSECLGCGAREHNKP